MILYKRAINNVQKAQPKGTRDLGCRHVELFFVLRKRSSLHAHSRGSFFGLEKRHYEAPRLFVSFMDDYLSTKNSGAR